MIGGLDDVVVRHAALVAPRHAYVPVPGLRVIDRPDWLQLVMPSVRQGGLNGVSHAVLADDEADAVIDATIAEYTRLGVKFRWRVDPNSRPLDLAARLARRGLQRSDGFAMVATTGATAGAGVPADVAVERITAATVDLYDQVCASAWGHDPVPLRAYHRAMLDDPRGQFGLYLARWRGEPAAVAASVHFERSAYLIGGVVLPNFRGRGLYCALVSDRMRDVAAAGLPIVTTHAVAATSAPILARLGFVTLCATSSFSSVTDR